MPFVAGEGGAQTGKAGLALLTTRSATGAGFDVVWVGWLASALMQGGRPAFLGGARIGGRARKEAVRTVAVCASAAGAGIAGRASTRG